jgi:hypothetical protein
MVRSPGERFVRVWRYALLLFAFGFTSLHAQPAEPSRFFVACIESGGTAGRATVRSGNSRLTLMGIPTASRFSLTLAPSTEVFSIQLRLINQPQDEPADPTMRPGEARISSASRIDIDGMGGEVGKSIDYCLRLV